MRSPTLGCSSKPLSRAPQPTRPLETVCVSLLDLVVALAKFLLLFIFSLEETTIQAFFLSRQPSLRAFPRHLFIMSFLGRSRPSCALVRSENWFLTLYHLSHHLCLYLSQLLMVSPCNVSSMSIISASFLCPNENHAGYKLQTNSLWTYLMDRIAHDLPSLRRSMSRTSLCHLPVPNQSAMQLSNTLMTLTSLTD